MTRLVIVESPAKSKKIQSFLPDGYIVDSCVGHVRDLPSKRSETPDEIKDKPWAEFAVDVDNGFKPYYIRIHGKGKVIQQLKKKLAQSDELYLATDEDREGEAISWHLVDELSPKVPVRRMVFNEITKTAIRDALESTRALDMHMVHAQETRRILDRLYGYALSPLLWKKVGGNLSAGRVQSVAVRLVVDRERDRRAFVSGTYWDLLATLEMDERFQARLQALSGKRVATGDDFDRDTGKIKEGADVVLLGEQQARDLQARLAKGQWTVTDIQNDDRQKSPDPPFTTSTLQQEASNRLDLSARDTMRTAQRLYENGFITYMRTDSTELSDEGLKGARDAIARLFGSDAAGPVRKYTKKAKNAQEAHEAIRPAGESFPDPEQTGLGGRELELYRLIWARTLASQMHNERFRITTASIDAEEARFVAKGRTLLEPGFRRVYPHAGRTMGALPRMDIGDHPGFVDVEAEGHETQPPARYTEASLVRALEHEGIGRPSTYASIMDTILGRGYVTKKGKALVPSFTAFAVVGLLEQNFPRLIDTGFTAQMEDELDAIAAGERDWVEFLHRFYHGPEGLQAQVDQKMEDMDPQQARVVPIDGLPCIVKIGRFGPYMEADLGAGTVTASIPENVTPDELDEDMVQRLIREKAEGPQSIGTDPDTKEPVYLLTGRFGPYLQLGEAKKGQEKPPRSSIPRGVSPEDVDLPLALFLLSLPRPLGEHPSGGRIVAGLGRYGPFVAHEKDGKSEYRSLKDFDHLRNVGLDEAVQLLAQPKGRGRGGQSVLKELGAHPKDDKPVQLLSGRYGPYVKHGRTNASLPKGTDPEGIDLQAAVQLLEAKAKRK